MSIFSPHHNTKENVIKSAIAIDLGAVNTGVFMVTHKKNETPKAEDCAAATIVMPPEGSGLTYSTKTRTAARHRLRGRKRFDMARRVLRLIVTDQLTTSNVTLQAVEQKKLFEALFGLLKRRGYNRLVSENDSTCLEPLDVSVFANHPDLTEFFYETSLSNSEPLICQWENLTQDANRRNAFLEKCPAFNDFKAFLKEEYPEIKELHKKYLDGLKFLRDDCKNINMQVTMGHKHRTQYLKEILTDMTRDSRLSPAVVAFGSVDRLWRLVGNISNLQLRAHRWYFNAPEMISGDRWEPERLQKTIARAFKYFHPATHEQAKEIKQLIADIESAPSITDALCTIDPNRTIPPYEDQNNRRPPVDMTLLLNPDALQKRFGSTWRSWADGLIKRDPSLIDNLDVILVHPDRKSRLPKLGVPTKAPRDYYFSYALQRALDRNKTRDPYALRALSSGVSAQFVHDAKDNLACAIGSQHVDAFIRFAADYYDEVQAAKSGLWSDAAQNLLERSDIHPPMKKRILDILVGNLFGLDQGFGKHFRENLWLEKLSAKSRSTMKSTCGAIEECRKDLGNEFNIAFQTVLSGREYDSKDVTRKLKSIIERIDQVKTFLAAGNIPNAVISRVCNPYSLAQLYTLIETERNGFSNTCISIHLENQWRMTDPDDNGAQCSRLPADAVRPFDGVLRKVLQRQAHELALLSMKELKEKVLVRDSRIDMSVIVEENKFAFSASLATIKKNNLALKKSQTAEQRQRARWTDKNERIKAASMGLCPYTGRPLGSNAEIDHIIPRSLSIQLMGTVFNSEANLIYVSQAGNQDKRNQFYQLSDLDSNYLAKQFGTTDIASITQHIEQTVDNLSKKNILVHFELLNEDEQRCVRHALFLEEASEARNAVMRAMAATNRSRVNGTQAWLIRAFIQKLSDMSASWQKETGNSIEFFSFRTPSQSGHDLRDALSTHEPSFAKPDIQPVASHSIDAMCAYASACNTTRSSDIIGGPVEIADAANVRSDANNPLVHLHPQKCTIVRVTSVDPALKKDFGSKQIFKEGIYAIRFLPILKRGKDLFIGFSLNSKEGKTANCIPVEGKNPEKLFELLLPYFTEQSSTDESNFSCHHLDKPKIFELMNKKAGHVADLTEEENTVLDISTALMYTTERQPLAKHLLTPDGKKFVSKNAITAEKLARIPCAISGKNLPFSAKGILTLPSWFEWLKVINHKDLADKWNQNLNSDENGDAPSFNLDNWLRKYFHMDINTRPRCAVKRVASLPVVVKTSGGFIIKRKNLNDQPIYQLSVINGVKFKGFPQKDGLLEWNQSKALLSKGLYTPNLTSLSMEEIYSDSGCTMNEWRTVHYDKDLDITISMAPGSVNRRYLRVRLPFADFIRWFPDAENKTAMTQPAEINAKFVPDFKNVLSAELAALLGTPRSNLFIEELGEFIQFRYIVSSSTTAMNAAYNSAAVQS